MSELEQVNSFKILPSEFKGAEFEIKQYCVTVRAGVPFDKIKDNPSAFAHVAGKLAENDIIHVKTADRAYYARLYVLSVHKQAAKVHVLEYHELPKGVQPPKDYAVEWGGRHKWRVVRVSDRFVVEHGFHSQEAAAEYAAEIGKKLAA